MTDRLRAAGFFVLGTAARHWIAAVPPLLVFAAWRTGVLDGASTGLRAGFLAFTCVLLPIAYHLSTRSGSKGAVAPVRSLGLALGAISLNGWLLFDRSDPVFRPFAYEQWLLVALVVAIEVRVTAMILSSVFRANPDEAAIAERAGLPRFVARLMILEANFWRAVYRFLSRRLFGRGERGKGS